MKSLQRGITLLLAGVSGAAVAAMPDGAQRNFVACPIVRDTASVPCWLAEYEGELYFLTLQTDVSAPVNPPMLGHKVLVEGRRTDKPRICGGIVLEPVRLSVLPALDANCNQLLPAEAQYNLTFEPPRPPGPSKGRLAFNTLDVQQAEVAPQRVEKRFTIGYDFEARVGFKHPALLQPVLDYALAIKATRIDIEGHRGAALLSDGTILNESPELARRRAQQVAELLQGAGLTAPRYTVRWIDAAPAPSGSDDSPQRRVDITVTP